MEYDHGSEAVEALPDYFNFQKRLKAPPTEVVRGYITPRSGAVFSPGGKIELDVPCSMPGQMLDCLQSALGFSIRNDSGQSLALDGGGHAVIDRIDVYHGSTLLSQISEYASLAQILSDFSCDLDSLKSSGTVRGVADYFLSAAANASVNGAPSYYSHSGKGISPGTEFSVIIPLISIIGTLSMKAIPLSLLMDSIRVEITLASSNAWGVYAAAPTGTVTIKNVKLHTSMCRIDGRVERAMIKSIVGGIAYVPTLDFSHYSHPVSGNAGAINFQIPVRASSITYILLSLKKTENLNSFSKNKVTCRSKAGMNSYRFRLGSQNFPQSDVVCIGSAAEARMELHRCFGGVAEASMRSCISQAEYVADNDDECVSQSSGV
jgi:hypothetical protein